MNLLQEPINPWADEEQIGGGVELLFGPFSFGMLLTLGPGRVVSFS